MDEFYFIKASLFFVTGLIFGSFFNVLIYRLPKGESIVWPGSKCPQCNRPIRFIENIPVLSYIFLGGKCAGCKKKISIQYPIIEFTTACALLFLWYSIALPFFSESHQWWDYCSLILQIAALLLLIPVSVIDIYHYIIPDSITLGGLILGITVSFIPGSITPLQSIIGIIAGGGSLLLIGLFGRYILRKKEAMGGGDIKLMAFLGAVWGWKLALLAIFFGALLGSVIGLLLIIIRILPEDRKIPFGPFLSIGIWTAVLCGDRIVTAYFEFIEHLLF